MIGEPGMGTPAWTSGDKHSQGDKKARLLGRGIQGYVITMIPHAFNSTAFRFHCFSKTKNRSTYKAQVEKKRQNKRHLYHHFEFSTEF